MGLGFRLLLHNCLNDFELTSDYLIFVGFLIKFVLELLDFLAVFLALTVHLLELFKQLGLHALNQLSQLFQLARAARCLVGLCR